MRGPGKGLLKKPFIAPRPPPRSSPSMPCAWPGRSQPAVRLRHLKESGRSQGSAQPPGLTLRLQQGEDVAFAHRPLHIADDGAAGVIHELHTHLWGEMVSARPSCCSKSGFFYPGVHEANIHTKARYLFISFLCREWCWVVHPQGSCPSGWHAVSIYTF